jgi:hypothetical protein
MSVDLSRYQRSAMDRAVMRCHPPLRVPPTLFRCHPPLSVPPTVAGAFQKCAKFLQGFWKVVPESVSVAVFSRSDGEYVRCPE